MRFYSESLRRAAEALETDPDRGLTAQEAARRLAQYGENQLRQAFGFSGTPIRFALRERAKENG